MCVQSQIPTGRITYLCSMHYTMRWVFILTVCLVPMFCMGQDAADEIRALLDGQAEAWNEGDIEGFMEGYHKTADLHFLGSSGLTAGWQETLDRYKTRYPDSQAMGKLRFELHEITQRTQEVYTVVGQFFLTRTEMEDLNGYFLLVVQRIDEQWRVVADSTH